MSETGAIPSDQPDPQLRQVLTHLPDSFQCLAWSPDGALVASGADDNTVRLWEARSGQLVRTLEGHTDSVASVVWAPDGTQLASGALDNTVRLWDSNTGAELQVYASAYPAHAVRLVSFQAAAITVDVLGKTKLGDPDIVIHILPRNASTRTATDILPRYVSAKIVLVGESNVGKSCLALRLAQDRYEEQGTTHGMRLWSMPPEQL